MRNPLAHGEYAVRILFYGYFKLFWKMCVIMSAYLENVCYNVSI